MRRRVETYALAALALAAGALLVAFGLIVLAGLVAAGTVVGGGIALYHRITGRWPGFVHVTATLGAPGGSGSQRDGALDLDPSREVFPDGRGSRRLPGAGGSEAER